jgi:hypothetical protein
MASLGGMIGIAIAILAIYIIFYPGVILAIPPAPGTGLMGVFPIVSHIADFKNSASKGEFVKSVSKKSIPVLIHGSALAIALIFIGPLVIDTRMD